MTIIYLRIYFIHLHVSTYEGVVVHMPLPIRTIREVRIHVARFTRNNLMDMHTTLTH